MNGQIIIWVGLYVGSVVLVNVGFSHMPGWELLWSVVVGTIFVARDFCQRAIGHWCLVAMGVAAVLSYLLADPYVALASVLAFAVSELADWGVYSVTKRPFADRILLSSVIAVPLDSAVFLAGIGLFGPVLFGVQVASKMAAALLIYGGLRYARTA